MVDMCSGPSLLTVASASAYFDKIYMSEYSPECRNFLLKWLHREKEALNWTPCLQMVADLEGKR